MVSNKLENMRYGPKIRFDQEIVFFCGIFKISVNSRFHELKHIHHITSYVRHLVCSFQLMKEFGKESTWKFHKSYFSHNFAQQKIWPILDHFMIASTKFKWHVMICSKKLTNKNLSETSKVDLEKMLNGKPKFIIFQDTQGTAQTVSHSILNKRMTSASSYIICPFPDFNWSI